MGTPNWAEIATAVAAVLTVCLLIWDRMRTRVPDLIITIESARSANDPDNYYLVFQPIDWGAVELISAMGQGVEISLPRFARDSYGEIIPVEYEPWARDAPLQGSISASDHRPLSVLLKLRSKPSRWRWRRTSVVTVNSLVTSPVRRRKQNKIAINIAS